MSSLTEKMELFLRKTGEVVDLRRTLALLQWDEEVCMPPKGAEARGHQIATLAALEHRLFTSSEMRDLVAELAAEASELSLGENDFVRETARDLERAVRLPESLVHRMAQAQSRAYHAWVRARSESAFGESLPHLAGLVALAREKAECLGYRESPYDALLEDYERGMTASRLRPIFDTLAERQGALVARIVESPLQPDTAWLDRDWAEDAQLRFTEEVLRDMGFDFEAGRQDKSVHPFTTSFDTEDVRVTTRVSRRDFLSALSSSVHEGGHALYEQGFPARYRRTFLADAPSLGMHESQSRLWENVVGRSLPFWRHYTPRVRSLFPCAPEDLSPEQVWRAANRVEPSLIRVEADECTYNLHIILRFEIETALIEGSIEAEHVPELWNERMRLYLGCEVPDDARGCLQDIHWSHGSFGYFPTYALGNLYAAQLMEKMEQDMTNLWDNVAQGKFWDILGWLRKHVHARGRAVAADQLLTEVTGQPPTPEPFLRYLEEKYSALYGLG